MKYVLLATTILAMPMAAAAQKCSVPAPAAAVGYNKQTLGGLALGKNWFVVCDGSATQNSDGTIRIPGGACNHYNSQITTGGQLFGGGAYIEGTIAIDNPPTGWPGKDGWPAFWGTSDKTENVEADFFEFMKSGEATFSSGLIDWGSGGIAANAFKGSEISMPNNDATQPHTYGWLWAPASQSSNGYVKMFVDGQLKATVHTWSYNGDGFSKIDKNQLMVILGTGSTNPMTIYDVRAWQASADQDAGLTSSSVIANSTCANNLPVAQQNCTPSCRTR